MNKMQVLQLGLSFSRQAQDPIEGKVSVGPAVIDGVVGINLMELDESILQVNVLKMLKNAGWNPSS